jgi:hypothetical protein
MRMLAVLLLLLLVPACGDEGDTIIVTQTTAAAAPEYGDPAVPGGVTSTYEFVLGTDVGPDGQPRLAFFSEDSFYFTRRLASGAWTTPLKISSAWASATFSGTLFVSSDGYSHVFWEEGSRIHYSRIDDAPTPAIDAGTLDVDFSAALPSNVGGGATAGLTSGFRSACDRPRNLIAVAWGQDITEAGAASPDLVPVVAILDATARTVTERRVLLAPNVDGNPSGSFLQDLVFSAAGILHAAWEGTLADGSASRFRHSARTSPGVWSGGTTGTALSGNPSSGIVNSLLLAPDGDAYLSWSESGSLSGTKILSARRPAGAASAFDPARTLLDNSDAFLFLAALEAGTETLHLVVRDVQFLSLTTSLSALHWTAPELGAAGAPSAVDVLVPTIPWSFADPITVKVWTDAADRLAVAHFRAPAPGDPSHLYLSVRPSGGAFAPAVDLLAPFALPASGFSVVVNAAGEALIGWAQGSSSGAPVSETFTARYSGGSVAPAVNVSRSPALGSNAPVALLLTDDGRAHVFWTEITYGSTFDLYYAGTP